MQEEILTLDRLAPTSMDSNRLTTSVEAMSRTLSGIQTRSAIVGVVGAVFGAACVLAAVIAEPYNKAAFLSLAVTGLMFVMSGSIALMATMKFGRQPLDFNRWDTEADAVSDLVITVHTINCEIRECNRYYAAGAVLMLVCPICPVAVNYFISF